jgi:hypothetical protein
MIQLRTLLAEQLDGSGELIRDDVFTDDMKQEYVDMAKTMSDEGDSDSLDILSILSWGGVTYYTVLGVIALLIPQSRKAIGKLAFAPLTLTRAGIVKLNPPFARFLFLRNTPARINWVRKSLLKPIDRKLKDLKKEKTTGKRGNTILTAAEIRGVEANIEKWTTARNAVNNISDDALTRFSRNVVREIKNETYKSLRTLRDKNAKVTPEIEKQLQTTFKDLKKLDDKVFDQSYVEVTLESLNIPDQRVKDRIINNVFKAEIAVAEKEATTAAQLAQFNKTAQELIKKLNSSDPAIRKQAEIESQLQKMSLRNASPNTPAQQTQIKNIIDDIETTLAASQTSKPTLTFAQNNYMMTIPISERPQFASIVNNLSAEINKRSKYVDDLMAYNQFPSQKEWRGLLQSKGDDILAADLIGQSLQYNNDKLFYHANKHSGSTIK